MVNGPCRSYARTAPAAARNAALLAMALALCCNMPAHATKMTDESHNGDFWTRLIDVANPYASLQYSYDSNVLRLDDITPAIDGRSDQYLTLALGFSSDIHEGQQRFVLNGDFTPVKFKTHNEYDYSGGQFAAAWHWTWSDNLTGTADYHFRRALRDFANELSPKRYKDVYNSNRVSGSADMGLQSNWKVGARAEFSDISYETSKALDLQRFKGGTNLTYVSRADNELGFDLTATHGNYVNRNASYDEYTVGPSLQWNFTVRTRLTADVGYTHRSGTNIVRPDYSGPTAHIALTIADAGRGSLKASAWQELSNLSDEIPDYTVSEGVSLEPGWTLSNGMTFRMRGSYEHLNFRDASGSSARLDDIGTVSGFLDWPLGRHLTLTAGLTTERRSSTRLYQDYEYLLQQIQITGTL